MSRHTSNPTVDAVDMARGFMVNGLTQLVSNLGAVFTLLVARLLGSSALGIFSVAWAATDLLVKLGTFGLDRSVMIHVAKSRAQGNLGRAGQIYRTGLLYGLALSVAVSALSVVAVTRFGALLDKPPELIAAVWLMFLAMPGITLYRVSTGASRGLRIMRHDLWSRGITETLVTILGFLVAFLVGLGFRAPIAAKVAGTLAGGFVAWALARKQFGGRNRTLRGAAAEASEPVGRPLLRFAAPVAFASFLDVWSMRLDVLVLSFFVGSSPLVTLSVVGVYAAAVEVTFGLRKLRQVFDPIFAPIVAEYSARRDVAGMQESFGRIGRWLLAILIPIVAMLCLATAPVLALFGPAFQTGALWLGILALAHGSGVFVSLGETLLLVERPSLNLVNGIVVAVVQLAVSLALVPRIGPTGAALGALITSVLLGALRFWQLKRILAWRTPWGALTRPAVIGAAALLPALALRLAVSGILAELGSALLFLGAYLFIWKVVGLDREDRETLQALWRPGPSRTEASV